MKIYSGARHTRGAYVLGSGQSLEYFSLVTPQYKAFIDRANELLITALPAGLGYVNAAYAGASAAYQHRDSPSSTNWYVNPDTSESGDRMLRALRTIEGAPSGAPPESALFSPVGERPTIVLWNQGQQDALFFEDAHGVARETAATRYDTATRLIFDNLLAVEPNSILVAMIGRYLLPNADYGVWRVRQIQLQIATTKSGCFKGHETYDMPLQDQVHPTDPTGLILNGRRQAEALARRVYGISTVSVGPYISAVAKTGANTATFTVTADANEATTYLANGVFPSMMRWENAEAPGVALTPTAISRSSGVHTVTFAETLQTPKLMFPYGSSEATNAFEKFDASRVIRGATTGLPLQSYLTP